jgi:hypothetical protein
LNGSADEPAKASAEGVIQSVDKLDHSIVLTGPMTAEGTPIIVRLRINLLGYEEGDLPPGGRVVLKGVVTQLDHGELEIRYGWLLEKPG